MKKEYLIYKLSEDLKEATRIENELFRDVYKRQDVCQLFYYGTAWCAGLDDPVS